MNLNRSGNWLIGVCRASPAGVGNPPTAEKRRSEVDAVSAGCPPYLPGLLLLQLEFQQLQQRGGRSPLPGSLLTPLLSIDLLPSPHFSFFSRFSFLCFSPLASAWLSLSAFARRQCQLPRVSIIYHARVCSRAAQTSLAVSKFYSFISNSVSVTRTKGVGGCSGWGLRSRTAGADPVGVRQASCGFATEGAKPEIASTL